MSVRSRYAPWFKRRRSMADIERAGYITYGLDDFYYDPLVRAAMMREWERKVAEELRTGNYKRMSA